RLCDRRAGDAPGSLSERERARCIAILAGYPDRVGRLRRPSNATGRSGREIIFAAGGTAALGAKSGLADVDLAVAVDVEERSDGPASARRTEVRIGSGIEADWLLELFTESVRDTSELAWNPMAARVERVRRLAYEGLVLEEARKPAEAGEP